MSLVAPTTPTTTAGATPVLAWPIDPLPDFLLDHTLADEAPDARLREVASRWVQMVGSLWGWRDAATFALRYLSDGRDIHVWFMAAAHAPAALAQLRNDVEVLLRANGLGEQGPILAADGSDLPLGIPNDWVVVEVRQHENRRFWELPAELKSKRAFQDAVKGDKPKGKEPWLPAEELEAFRVIFPWWAPGGPFLLPMEKLLSQTDSAASKAAGQRVSLPTSLTIYLAPTELTEQERAWLTMAASGAQTFADQSAQGISTSASNRQVDPSASLVGRLYMANLRRLSDKPYLVAVHCAAAGGRLDAARSLAGTMESLVYEPPFDRPQQDDDRLPSAADVCLPTADGGPGSAAGFRAQYHTLRFMPPVLQRDPLGRLPYLADARGAATAFRLPINVRGGIPGLRVEQRPPDFHPGPRREAHDPATEILLGRLHQGGVFAVKRVQFTQHALITGFTGSGKTVTLLNLVHQLHAGGTPVLIIESAKQEYRGLLGVVKFVPEREGHGQPLPALPDDPVAMHVYTVGNEGCAPLRINPFELLPGVRVEAHVSRLQTCFEAALPPIGPLSSMIGEALIDVYVRRGWCLSDIAPKVGEPMYLVFPTMRDFYERMDKLVEERGYEGDVRSNVRAAVLGRIKPLTIGSKGLIFRDDQPHVPGELRGSSPVSRLFERTAVVELNDLNLDDKALVVMVLLTFLREYREAHKAARGQLAHATVVEEAHNVLENVQSSGNAEGGAADTRYKAVQAFSAMLTEIRSLGEGLIIADQSPEKLAPDAMRNTNIQIAHQLRDSRDREAVARAMIMDDAQRDFLGKLGPGQAALFATGLQKATFIRVPKYYPTSADLAAREGETAAQREARLDKFDGWGYRDFSDAEVRRYMEPVVGAYRTGPFGAACDRCDAKSRCAYRPKIVARLATTDAQSEFNGLLDRFSSGRADRLATLQEASRMAFAVGMAAAPEAAIRAGWCGLIHLWHGRFAEKTDPLSPQTFDIYHEHASPPARS